MRKCEKSLYDVLKQVDTSGTPWWIGLVILGVLFATFGPLFCCCYLYYRNDNEDSEGDKPTRSTVVWDSRVASISQALEHPRQHQQVPQPCAPPIPLRLPPPSYSISYEDPPPSYADIFRTSSAASKSTTMGKSSDVFLMKQKF